MRSRTSRRKRGPAGGGRGPRSASRGASLEQTGTVLGIDPGLERTGYGLVNEAGDTLIAAGLIKTSRKDRIEVRLADLFKKFSRLVKKLSPGMIVVEKLFFNVNVRTAIHVAHARGVILASAAGAKAPVMEVTPQKVKKAVSGYGAAPKDQVMEMVCCLLNLKKAPRPDDVADAIAIALCGAFQGVSNPAHPVSSRLVPAVLPPRAKKGGRG